MRNSTSEHDLARLDGLLKMRATGMMDDVTTIQIVVKIGIALDLPIRTRPDERSR